MDSLVIANVKQRPFRTAISVIGVALGVILVVLTVGLARGMMRDAAERQANVDAELRFYSGDKVPTTVGANPLMMPARYADAILNGIQPTPDSPDVEPKPPVEGVAAATPIGMWMQTSVGGIGFEFIDGIEYDSFIKATQLRIVDGRPLRDGRIPGSEFEAIVDRYYADNSTDVRGDRVRLGSKIPVLGHEFTVIGIYEPSMLSRVKIPLSTLQQLLGGADNCTFVLVRTDTPELAERVSETLTSFYPGNSVMSTSQIPALYSQGIRPLEAFLNVVIGLSMVISTLVILLAMYTTIIERTREIGILKSLGASRRFIVMAIEKEAALISLLGIVVGFVVSVVAKYGIQANTKLQIDLQPKWLLIGALIGISAGVIGALYPAAKAAKLDPIDALSYE